MCLRQENHFVLSLNPQPLPPLNDLLVVAAAVAAVALTDLALVVVVVLARLSTQSLHITLVDTLLATSPRPKPQTRSNMFAAKAFTIASLILVGAKAVEVSTPSNVVQVRKLPVPRCSPASAYHLTLL